MKLFLVSRTDRVGWDEYIEFVCASNSEESARKLYPLDFGLDCWVKDISTLNVRCIGIANPELKEGDIVCASFNAG